MSNFVTNPHNPTWPEMGLYREDRIMEATPTAANQPRQRNADVARITVTHSEKRGVVARS